MHYTQVVTYTVKDSDDERTAQDTITITVNCLRATPIARPDEKSTNEETPVDVDPLIDNGNDEDPEGDDLTVEYVEQPNIGSRTLIQMVQLHIILVWMELENVDN